MKNQQVQTSLGIEFETIKEDPKEILKQLTAAPCRDCHLGLLHPDNRGVIWRGNVLANIAVLAEAPGDKETEQGLPLVGPSGQEFERWMKYIGINTKTDIFASNVIQCQPERAMKEGKMQQLPPNASEITACFPHRGLRLLSSLPNLEVVITAGWVAAQALLGGSPTSKTHEGTWFHTDRLPGVAVFCLVHPSYILRDPSPEKKGRLIECLEHFKREYLDTRKVVNLAQALKV